MAKRKAFNPFYPLLVLTGVLFTVTAFAYGLLLYRLLHPALVVAGPEDGGSLMVLMHRHGTSLLVIELAALATFALLAMATDRYWSRMSHRPEHDERTDSGAAV
jgi:hypothetical protein